VEDNLLDPSMLTPHFEYDITELKK